MRELNFVELHSISGGDNNKGYTFSFIIENTCVWAAYGFGMGVLTGNAETLAALTGIGAAFGATYATAMMITTALDNQVFSPTPAAAIIA